MCLQSMIKKRINELFYQYLKKKKNSTSIYIFYIIAKAERKWIPTIKEVLTNRKSGYLKFRHIYIYIYLKVEA